MKVIYKETSPRAIACVELTVDEWITLLLTKDNFRWNSDEMPTRSRPAYINGVVTYVAEGE